MWASYYSAFTVIYAFFTVTVGLVVSLNKIFLPLINPHNVLLKLANGKKFLASDFSLISVM